MTKAFSYKYIYNPKTGRKVLANGKIGRKIIKTFLRKIFQRGGSGPPEDGEWEPGASEEELDEDDMLAEDLRKSNETAHELTQGTGMTKEEKEKVRMKKAIDIAAGWVNNPQRAAEAGGQFTRGAFLVAKKADNKAAKEAAKKADKG